MRANFTRWKATRLLADKLQFALMELLRQRLPSRQEAAALIMVIALPIHIRAWLIFLHEAPGYILRMTLWDVAGICAYVQFTTFLETAIFLVGFLFLSITLPEKFFRTYFVPQGSLLFILFFFWLLPFHNQYQVLARIGWDLTIYAKLVAAWFGLFALLAAVFLIGLRRLPRLVGFIQSSIRRITPLSITYLAADLIFILILAVRYLG